jgi:hypothetical protein
MKHARKGLRFRRLATMSLLPGALLAAALWAQPRNGAPALTPPRQAALKAAFEWVQQSPRAGGHWEYIMTGRVRLLFFWVGRDDVGGGIIRRGPAPADAQMEVIQLLVGSDPERAPRRVNRWGLATEAVHRSSANGGADASAFFGFMTRASSDASAEETKQQMEMEKAGKGFLYQTVVSHLNGSDGVAKTVPFASSTEFTLHELAAAQQRVFQEFNDQPGKIRITPPELRSRCPRVRGFLASVAELVDGAIGRGQKRAEVCYLHYGELYTLRLADAAHVAEKKIEVDLRTEPKQTYARAYRNLLNAKFEIINHQTGKKSRFELLLGTEGALRGAPVQITYQPNWWFQVVLNLKT